MKKFKSAVIKDKKMASEVVDMLMCVGNSEGMKDRIGIILTDDSNINAKLNRIMVEVDEFEEYLNEGFGEVVDIWKNEVEVLKAELQKEKAKTTAVECEFYGYKKAVQDLWR